MKNGLKIYLNEVFKKIQTMPFYPNSEKVDVVAVIKKYVPDFMHIETGKHLDQKM